MEKLSASEELTMQAVWQVGPGFIKDFMQAMPTPRPPYTTFASTLKNLERKGFLKSERFANLSRYRPRISEMEYKKRFMNGFVNSYFENNYKQMVAFFVKDKKLSAADLKELIHLIENSEK